MSLSIKNSGDYMSNIVFAFTLSTLAGLSTLLGFLPLLFNLKDESSIILKSLAFASGVMLTVSIIDLIPESYNLLISIFKGFPALLLLLIFLVIGIIFSILIDKFLPNNNNKLFHLGIVSMLAIILHNIPEGMAVGVIYAGLLSGAEHITEIGAFSLALGIAIQNFPEGAIISLPLCTEGMSKKRAFIYGVLSGAVEPVAAVFTVWAASLIVPLLPYFLSFAAGAMFYVVVEELVPKMSVGKSVNVGFFMFSVGFTLMMILDVALA